ncbi:MAG: hypothetical protein AAF628_27785 [Planctomycetota bacterium]
MHQYTLLLACLTAGCTSPLVRQASADLATHIDELGGHMAIYQRALETDAARRIERIASQREELASLEFQLQERLAVWRLLGRKQAISFYEGVQELIQQSIATTTELETSLAQERKALRANQTEYANQRTNFASLAKQLRAMAEEPDLKTQVSYLVEFAKEVRDEVEKLEAAEENQTTEDEPGSE